MQDFKEHNWDKQVVQTVLKNLNHSDRLPLIYSNQGKMLLMNKKQPIQAKFIKNHHGQFDGERNHKLFVLRNRPMKTTLLTVN